MEIRRITQTSDPLYEQAMALYTISFPFHEQRQALSQSQILQQDAYHFDVICDNGEFVGEILYWDIGNALYIEHFCVSPAMRNRHYGQRILSAYQSTPLILEIDHLWMRSACAERASMRAAVLRKIHTRTCIPPITQGIRGTGLSS